ncbi:MAG: putative LPS assembly protein LptD [Saprospiraceae bacterium]
MGKYRLFWQLALVFAWSPVFAQVPVSTQDTLPLPVRRDSAAVRLPLAGIRDTALAGLRDSSTLDLRDVRVSSESLDEPVDYGSTDSMWFDVKNKQLHLYGKAFVKYGVIDLAAGYIVVDYNKNEVSAQEHPDSSGTLAGLPEFKDGNESFTAKRLRYNFRSKKGIIYEARTKQEDLYVLGKKAKFVSAPPSADSTQRTRNTIYNQDAILTTCDHPEPHFGIRTSKLKVIPDKLVVTGFSNVEIGGIPTPLFLPFGFYPITKTSKSGLIIPRDFEPSNREGLGIKDWGYYIPLSDHMDVTFLFNAYTSGSWGVRSNVRYNQRYMHSGSFSLEFNDRIFEDAQANRLSNKSFGIRWTHQQDSKAHPSRTFGGSITIETNRNQNRNRNDYASVVQNQLTSNLNYSQTFPGRPYQFNASLSHSQNTQTRLMSISFPNATFNLQRIFPFKRENPTGKEQWYEKISLTYSSSLRNDMQVVDTLLFTDATLRNARMGIQHKASTDFNIKLFKYINIAPRVNYEENWYPYTIEREFLDEIQYAYDTVAEILVVDSARTVWGRDTSFRDWGFKPFRTYDIGISLNTALFFTKQFKKGWFRGIRHTMKPSISTGFRPDFSESDYFRKVQISNQPGREVFRDYGVFDESVFGRPTSGKPDLSVSYSLTNILEMKFYSAKRDTVKRVRIFDNLAFSGSYSLTRDTLKWSLINTGGLFRFFKGVSNLTWNATFDPYVLNDKGVRVNKFAIREEGKLLRLASFGIALNTSATIRDLRNLFAKEPENQPNNPSGPATIRDGFFDLLDQFQVGHRFSIDRRQIFGTNRDTFLIGTNNLSFSGRIPLSPKWSIDVGNLSYDFQQKSLIYPDIGFTRDLHCWLFSLRWWPDRNVYEFFISVKPGSTLDFLKLPYRKNVFDGQSGF